MKRALARTLAIGLGTTTLLVGLVGVAHTPVGRPFLGAITRMAHGGCPFGYDQAMSPAQREHARRNFSASHHGERPAASRPALGFVLDHSTRNEVVARMAKHGITCTAGRGLSDLTCNAVPSSALGGSAAHAPDRNLWFTFGAKDQLLSVVAMSHDARPESISDAFAATRSALDEQTGAISALQGDADPRALSSGLLRQASAELRCSDYYALTRASNLGKSFALLEEYRSLAD
jgi:hypothetical protein